MTVRIQKPAVNIREKLAELERPIGINGQALLATDTPQQAFDLLGSAGNKNLIINGDFKISQRATDSGTISLITVEGYRIADRWKDVTYNNSGTFTPQYRIRQFADHPISGSQGYCLRYDCVTADTPATNVDFLSTFQAIESNNTINLYNNYSSVSFWVKSSSPGPYSIQIRAAGSTSASTPNLLLKYNINNSNVWEYKTLLVPPQNLSLITGGNGTGYTLHFVLSSGLNKNYDANVATIENKWALYSSNGVAFTDQTNLMATAGNYWQITNIQLEVGKVATPFEYRSYGQELALCQRYFQTIPAQWWWNRTATGTSYSNATLDSSTIILPVPMRATPTASRLSDGALFVTSSTYNSNYSTVATRNIRPSVDSNSNGTIILNLLYNQADNSSTNLPTTELFGNTLQAVAVASEL